MFESIFFFLPFSSTAALFALKYFFSHALAFTKLPMQSPQYIFICTSITCTSPKIQKHSLGDHIKHAGYITGDDIRSETSKSGRQLGPYQSAKVKPRRRSKSVNSALQQYTNAATRSQQIYNRNVGRESRSKYRTPAASRIQTMSADRCMGPVTPKVPMGGQSVAMLRYARQGETVISLDGSPVVASK